MAGPWIADRRIVLTPDRSRVLDADEEQSGIQLATKGGVVSDVDCKRYSLGAYAAKPEAAADAEPEAEGEAPTPKARSRSR